MSSFPSSSGVVDQSTTRKASKRVATKMKGQVSSEELRRSLVRRRMQEGVQIRKQRKEERLQARRFGGQSSTSFSSEGFDGSSNDVSSRLKQALETYSTSSGEQTHLELIRRSLSNCEFQASVTLEQFLADQPDKSKTIITLLTHTLRNQNPSNDGQHQETFICVCQILLAISGCLTRRDTASAQQSDDNYYGRPPMRWSDLMLEESMLLPALLSFVHHPVVPNILGNIVQDAGSSAVHHIWPSWSAIVSQLPTTSYLCAAMAQKDNTSFASYFMENLTTQVLTSLLQQRESDSTFVDAAWILEGVSRREDAAVKLLCQDEALMHALAALMMEHTTASNAPFLFPAVKAVGNMAVACDGTFIPLLLSVFSQHLTRILENGILLEGVKTASCFLVDAGLRHHASTHVGIPAFVPSLIRMVVVGTLDWKREAVIALELALADPPLHASVDDQLNDTTSIIWNMLPDDKNTFLMALLEISMVPDMSASLSAVRVLDRFLRSIPNSPAALAAEHEPTVVDRLHTILAVGSNNPQFAAVNDRAEIALDLLDDFFERDDEDEEDEYGATESGSPALAPDGTFTFGVPETRPKIGGQQQLQPLERNSPPRSMGRGRGRVVPSWMSQQQQQPQQSL